MSDIRSRLTAIGRPMVTVSEIAFIGLQISPQALHQRLNFHRDKLTRPDTFRAGGAHYMMLDEAVKWAEQHISEWENRK